MRTVASSYQTHIRSPLVAAAPLSRILRLGLRRTGPFSKAGCGPVSFPVRPPGSAGADRVPSDVEKALLAADQALLIRAPSITTPAVANFQSATSSLRAKATFSVLRRRPPLRSARSWNQRLSAELGWCRNHSQASW